MSLEGLVLCVRVIPMKLLLFLLGDVLVNVTGALIGCRRLFLMLAV